MYRYPSMYVSMYVSVYACVDIAPNQRWSILNRGPALYRQCKARYTRRVHRILSRPTLRA